MTAIFVTGVEIWRKESFVYYKASYRRTAINQMCSWKTDSALDKDICISKRFSDEVTKDGINQRRTCAFVLKRVRNSSGK